MCGGGGMINLRRLVSRSGVVNTSVIRSGFLLSRFSCFQCVGNSTVSTTSLFQPPIRCFYGLPSLHVVKDFQFLKHFGRHVHSVQQFGNDASSSSVGGEIKHDGTTNDFLSRFVWIMRKRLNDAFPGSEKNAIDGMLVIIVEKVVSELEKGGLERLMGADISEHPKDFSVDLWETVWETSNQVLQDMDKEKKKENMKTFLQSEEVKEMYRIAGQIGIRGDLLRELRFKWAREKMEESEFYENLEKIRKENMEMKSHEKVHLQKETLGSKGMENDFGVGEGKARIDSLPKRHGSLKYKIYGLDLSRPEWAAVANKIHENVEDVWPQSPKMISGKCKLVTSKIMSSLEEDDPAPLLAEWIALLQPSRNDWIALLDELKVSNSRLYFKISEYAVTEESFKATTHDYSKLADALAKENRIEDAERILKKMVDNGILPDVITSIIAMQMYCASGNLDRAKEEFESLRAKGFQPDTKVYTSMIMAYARAGRPQLGETLMREMENNDLQVTSEIYIALLQSFAHRGDAVGADRISTTMQFVGIQPTLESCTLMVEVYARLGDPENARRNFDYMRTLGLRPDDKCISTMISAYQKNNLLDKALNLLLELENDGFLTGVLTYTTFVDWLTRLELFDEAEQLLDNIAALGDAPPFKLHISLCDMYSRTGNEKKALQALGVIESRIDQLESEEFYRIITSLEAGGFVQDAQRIRSVAEARGIKLAVFSTSLGIGMSSISDRHRQRRIRR